MRGTNGVTSYDLGFTLGRGKPTHLVARIITKISTNEVSFEMQDVDLSVTETGAQKAKEIP